MFRGLFYLEGVFFVILEGWEFNGIRKYLVIYCEIKRFGRCFAWE